MSLFQTLPAVTEPILQGGLIVGGGCVVVWFAHRVNTIYDWTRDIKHMLIGPPDAKIPTGLVADGIRHEEKLDTLEQRVNSLWSGFDDVSRRVVRVEDRCDVQHRKNINGDPL